MPYACPLCGATSNRKGKQFDTADKVVAHIDAKRDDTHAGESGGLYREEIQQADGQATPQAATTDGGTAAKQPTTTGQSTVEVTPEEFDEAVQNARQTGYEQGLEEGKKLNDEEIQQIYNDAYEEGYREGKQEAESAGNQHEFNLGCGHESIDFDELLDGVVVQCETCGRRFEW